MSACYCAAYAPAANLSRGDNRKEKLKEILNEIPADELMEAYENFMRPPLEEDSPSFGTGAIRQGYFELIEKLSDLLHTDEWESEELALFAPYGLDHQIWVTAGLSYGGTPTEVYENVCACTDFESVENFLLQCAKEDFAEDAEGSDDT